MASLRDVAQHAGVSVATASRVVSGFDGVRTETRDRVERAMRDLLYVPPGRRPATGMIGLLVPSLENPIFPALAQALEERATEAGYASILCNTTAAAFREVDYVHMLLDRGADGMIFISCEMTNMSGIHDHYGRLVEEGARLVFVNGALNTLNVPSVGVDEQTAGELATQHLIDLGHRRIGYVAGPDHYLPTRQKAAGWASALGSAGLNGGADELVAYGHDFTVEAGRVALRDLLARDRPPTGVICSSDLMAIGVLQEAAERGLRVPEDLSVVGFDGIEPTAWTKPALTTVEQPIEEIAETAVNALRTRMDAPRKPLPDSFFRPRLRQRASTAPPAVG
jgi:DNA-binding LacI/PurR family transcriptional regulator